MVVKKLYEGGGVKLIHVFSVITNILFVRDMNAFNLEELVPE